MRDQRRTTHVDRSKHVEEAPISRAATAMSVTPADAFSGMNMVVSPNGSNLAVEPEGDAGSRSANDEVRTSAPLDKLPTYSIAPAVAESLPGIMRGPTDESDIEGNSPCPSFTSHSFADVGLGTSPPCSPHAGMSTYWEEERARQIITTQTGATRDEMANEELILYDIGKC